MNDRKRNELSIFRPFKSILDIFEDDFGNFGLTGSADRSIFETSFVPAIDVDDKKDKYVVKAEIPGLSKDDIKVNVRDDTLIISGEKKTENERKEDGYYYSERSYGSFYRSIPLSKYVVTDKIKANYKNGVLEIELPKNKSEKIDGMDIKIE